LLRILEHFGLRAEEGIFIGDSEVDRQHSAAVGMEMIAFRNASLSAEYHADSFGEVARLPMFPDSRG
jgi:phosphoglycolate phosphatase-like HAD superfamily hydrolase